MAKKSDPKLKKRKLTRYNNGVAIVANHRFRESGAYKLKERLQCYLLKPEKLVKASLSLAPIIFNWGSSRYPTWLDATKKPTFFNNPENVRNAINKLMCLRILKEQKVPCLDFYTDKKEAARAAFEKSAKIFCRTRLTASGGDGIVIQNYDENLVDAPLYTINFPKTHEYRIHVAFGKIIDIAQKKTMGEEKRKENQVETINNLIRNHTNGWFYSKEDLLLSDTITNLAMDAIKALNLDYGAVDILAIWAKGDIRKCKKAVVCEINTAPGLAAESTLQAYEKAFKEQIHG